MPAYIVLTKRGLCSSAAAYLLVFHICFVMFCWTYWKAIFTPVATPSKKVGIEGIFSLFLNHLVDLTELLVFSLCVYSSFATVPPFLQGQREV